MNSNQLKQIKRVIESFPEVKLVYFFGSKAKGEDGPLSDYDFAMYIDGVNKDKIFAIRSELLSKICLVLKTDEVDLVILNTIESPEIKYNIIKEGKLIFEREPYKVIVEPKIMNEYFDFHLMLKEYSLTKS